MGDPGHNDKDRDTLRARALERMEKGLLPRAKPARTWGGRGSGLCCNLCDVAIADAEPEMELEFEGTVTAHSLHFHLQCHSIWDSERHAPPQQGWMPVEVSTPPFDTLVEARVHMAAGRTVILGVMRMRARGGDAVWMNPTTSSPLPATWRPIEWRYPDGQKAAEHATETSAPKRA